MKTEAELKKEKVMEESKVMSEVPKNHPMMIAWNDYKETDDYKNSWRWADQDEHRDGSLWAAFVKGWESNDIMSDFEWCKKLLEKMCGYSITPGEGGEWKLIWIEGGKHFETFETELGVIALVGSMCEESDE